jgi:long-chain acyl-CoA synthetase
LRERLSDNPTGTVYLHDVMLSACSRNSHRMALIDLSCSPPKAISYSEYGDLVERMARGLLSAGLREGDRVAFYLFNCWEYAVALHGTTLAGGIPTFLNPSYREREVTHQLRDCSASFLITDGPLLPNVDFSNLRLRGLFLTRVEGFVGAEMFSTLLKANGRGFPELGPPGCTLAALPYSSGTTGLPKGVMLTHYNLVSNIRQMLGPESSPYQDGEVTLCFLPLYHIYGLNGVLNPTLAVGGTVVLLPRFEQDVVRQAITQYGISFLPLVPAVVNALSAAWQDGLLPHTHSIRWAITGAAPIAPEAARRFGAASGITLIQGYGMTETSPVTHIGFHRGPLVQPDSIGAPLASTQCRLMGPDGSEVGRGQDGEMVISGPQVMEGYWNAPAATAEALRRLDFGGSGEDDSIRRWFWSGDIARQDGRGLYYIVGRVKEMIKYKGFPIAPAEIEAVLLEHPHVQDCAVIGRGDAESGEVPCALVVLRESARRGPLWQKELCDFVGDRLAHFKCPREVQIVDAIPRNPSGKILRDRVREMLH